jgi:predicted phage terminase large subunit-like protein
MKNWNDSSSPEGTGHPDSQQALAEELLRRRKARSSLLDFVLYNFAGYKADPAHYHIASYLDRVVEGSCTRLMIFCAPQHGKSCLVSEHLPAYWLGRRPDDPIILASYKGELAETKSRTARSIVESPKYAKLFPGIATDRSSRAVDYWQLQGHRGRLLAAGVGGSITGHGAQLGIIDDPVKDYEEAMSEPLREKAWDWYRNVFRTRVWESGAIILVMTRWHEDDLAGRLLRDNAGEWEVLRLPALAEHQAERDENNERLGLLRGLPDPLGRKCGEPLCPQRYSKDALEKLRRDSGSLAWAAQYQGVPRAAEGNRFKRQWFPIVEAAPGSGQRVRYWDQAATADGGCYTAGVLMCRGQDGLYFVEDVVRGQWSAGDRDKVMKQVAELDRQKYGNGHVRIWVEEEPGSGGKESAQAKIKLLAGHTVHAEKVTGSKEVRAEPLAAHAEAGNVRLVRGAWNSDFLEELASFPNGRYSDQVDASSGAFNKLAAEPPPFKCPTFAPERPRRTIVDRFEQSGDLALLDRFERSAYERSSHSEFWDAYRGRGGDPHDTSRVRGGERG